ncbi:hypothetical protein L596_001166 [Steinernema carpocapsae]|uniref:Uncharacterized protein n=1 Tax=Steinernema carpocapsae TaxID=34508 RepID=A0A4V6I709_STECR|nr:hypothetical protein L596_001166 [Steinernema carpocapsae]
MISDRQLWKQANTECCNEAMDDAIDEALSTASQVPISVVVVESITITVLNTGINPYSFFEQCRTDNFHTLESTFRDLAVESSRARSDST